MDIYWYGQACFKIKGKTSTIIIDPFDPEYVGLKAPKDLSGDILLVTHDHKDHSFIQGVSSDPILIKGPGEYDVKGVPIAGISTYHDQDNGQNRGKNTVYHMLVDGLNIVHLGDLGHKLTDEQVQEIGNVDILLIPVGGNYTIDAKEATEVVTALEPSIIIPMHYKLDGLKVDIGELSSFLKEIGAENAQPQPKLSITKDKLPDEPQTIVLAKS